MMEEATMKKAAILLYIAALCFYATAALTFFSSHNGSQVAIWISIGTIFIVLGVNQGKNDK